MVFKTSFKVKTTLIAIFALIFIATACMACLSCANDTEYVYEESISLMAMPNKTEYVVGDTLDLTGLAVTSIGKDGKLVVIPDSEIAVEPPHGTPIVEAGTLTVTVSHGKRSLTFPVKVTQATSCLYVKTPPKRAYYAGERLDLSGLELVLRENGEETTVAYSDAVSSEPENGAELSIPADAEDGSRATRTVALSYGDLSCSFDISIRAVRLVDLYLKSLPDRTNYYTGGTLDLAGLELVAVFSDGTVSVVNDYTVTETPDFAEAGKQTVTLSYLDKQVSFPITVFKTYLAFSEQPQDKEIALYAENETLSAKIIPDGDGEVTFVWYRKNSGEADFSEIVRSKPEHVTSSQAKENVLVLPKNDYVAAEYYCVATLMGSSNTVQSAKSDTACVTQRVDTELPLITITTVNNEEPTCNYRSAPPGESGAGICDATKVPGRLVMTSGSETWYDSEEYDAGAKKGMTIKIRGNTSAYSAKKPYKIKLQKGVKADLLAKSNGRSDSIFEERDWILLKDGTSLNTFVGMTVADIAGTEWTPEFAFVNLVLNDNYRGVYLLIESIGRGDGRINIKKSGYVIERDAYWWNEQADGNPYFKTTQNKGYTFKYPDEDDITSEQIEYIKNYMNLVEASITDGTYDGLIETETFARWLLVHDMLGTWDSHGSNVYITKNDNTDSSKIRMSTPWDFDSNYYMEGSWANIHNDTYFFYMNRLLSSENTEFLDSYKAHWDGLKGKVQSELNTTLSSLRSRQGDAINASRRLDATRWGGTYKSVEDNISTAENWFTSRIPWLETHIGEM